MFLRQYHSIPVAFTHVDAAKRAGAGYQEATRASTQT